MEKVPRSWRGVCNRFNRSPEEVQAYFSDIPELIETYDWEVSLGFMFTRLEKALNRMLYCGAVKMHRAESEKAKEMVNKHHMTRKEFRRLFNNVFGKPVRKELTTILQEAEEVRDKVVHGKNASAPDQRKAIVRLLEYAEGMNDQVNELAGFKPFTSDLRGFTGRREALDKATTAWLMKGLGFQRKSAEDADAS